MAEQGPTFKVGFESDDGENRTEADRMAEIIAQGLQSAFARLGPQLAKEFAKSFKSGTKGLFDDLTGNVDDFRARTAEQTARMEGDLKALSERAQATKDTLSKIGSDPRLFAVFDRNIANAMSTLRELDRQIQAGTATPKSFKELQASIADSSKLAQKELAGFQSTVKAESAAASKSAEAARAATQQAETRRNRESQQAHGKYIAQYQRETAQTLAETRNAGRLQVNQERATQRQRLEVIRFAFNQIKTIERGIGAVFSGSARLASSAVGGISAVTSRLAGIFKRSNRDMNDGLAPALRAREGALSRSFRSQSSVLGKELRQQSVLIERFDRQTSGGVFGALTGRSRVGTALGLGAGIGGGFALFQGLRNGLQVGGDFVQGLAVLQAQLELTSDEMKGVREQSIALGNDISLPGVSALDAAQAIQILAKQFGALGAAALPAAQAAAKGVLQLSRAAGVSSEEAARIIGAAVNVFGVAADKATAVADQITNALTKGAGVSFTDFADSFVQGAGVFKLFIGPAQDATKTLAEFNAGLDVLAKGGLTGSQAGAALKQFFLQANRGTKDAKKSLDLILGAANATGTLFFDATGGARTFTEVLDILRRGLKGLDDQTRSTTLQKLFGSRATTAANLFINTTAKEFRDLTDAQLKQGSAANIAAAQNTGLRGALDALQSVIETQQIKTYEKFQGVLGKVVVKFADLLNAFFEGRGIFGVIRAGLTGIVVVLGGLLIAKTAAESIKLLTIALTGLGSPLGVIVTGLAAIGGAISIFAATSPPFRRQLELLGRTISDAIRTLGPVLGEGLSRLAQIIRTQVIPRVTDFAVVLIRQVGPAVVYVKGLFDAFMDGLTRARGANLSGRGGIAGFLERTGATVQQLKFGAEAFVEVLKGNGLTTKGGIVGFAERLALPIRTAYLSAIAFVEVLKGNGLTTKGGLVGFSERLGLVVRDIAIKAKDAAGAVASLFTGGTNAGALVKSIVSSVDGLGRSVIGKLRTELALVLGFVTDFLANNLKTNAGRVGKTVTDFLVGPFQSAVTQLGFFLGNLLTDPRLVHAIEKLLGLAVLTGANFAKGLVQGAISNLPELMNLFVGQLDSAFNSALKSAFTNPQLFAKLIAGVLLANVVIRSFRQAGEAGARGMAAGFAQSFRTSNASPDFLRGFLGGTAAIDSSAASAASTYQKAIEKQFAKANRDLERLGKVPVTPTGEGLISVTDADVATQSERLGRMKANIGQLGAAGIIARARLREGFRGISDDFTDLAAQMGSKGRAIGSVLGTGIIAGVGAALSGQQLGGASSVGGKALGLAGIIGSALIPLATLPTTIGAPLAAVTLGIGLLTAAFSKNGDAAKESEARVSAYVDILKEFNSVSAASPALTDKITDSLLNQGSDVRDVLQKSGFSVKDFVDQLTSGQGSIAGAIRDLTSGLGVDQRRVQAFIASEQQLGHSSQQAIDDLNKAARGRTSTNQAAALVEELRKGSIDAKAFSEILQVLFDEGGDLLTGLGSNDLRQQLTADKDAGDALHDSFHNINEQVKALNRASGGLSPTFLSNMNNGGVLAAIMADNIDALNVALDSLNQKRTEGLNSRIADITSQLDAARAAADQALQSILDLVSGDLFGDQQNKLDELLRTIPDVASSLTDAIKGDVENGVAGLNLKDLFKTGAESTGAGAALRGILEPFRTALQGIVAQAITDGARTPQALSDALAPARAEIKQLDIPNDIKQTLLDELDGFLQDEGLTAGLNQITISEKTAADLQKQLDGLNAQLQVKVHFDEFQVRAELQRLQDLGLFTGNVPTAAQLAAAQAAAVEANRPAVTSPASADAAARASSNFTVEELNIYETQNARATGDETTRSLRAAAASGRLIITPGSIS